MARLPLPYIYYRCGCDKGGQSKTEASKDQGRKLMGVASVILKSKKLKFKVAGLNQDNKI
jgi:hypothetical protein